MNKKIIAVAILAISYCHVFSRQLPANKKAVIDIRFSANYVMPGLPNEVNRNVFKLEVMPVDYVDFGFTTYSENITGNRAKFTIAAEKPLLVRCAAWRFLRIIYPGDSISMQLDNNATVYSGKGHERFELQDKLNELWRTKTPTRYALFTKSLAEYTEWMKYSDSLVALVIPLLESYKGKISDDAFAFIKTMYLLLIEDDRCSSFYGISNLNGKGLTGQELANIWDSTQVNTLYGPWLRSFGDVWFPTLYYFSYNRMLVRRRLNFDYTTDTLKLKPLRVTAYYKEARNTYKGVVRERLLHRVVSDETIAEVGPASEVTKSILEDYFSLPGFPEYRQSIKKYLEEALTLRAGERAPSFVLADKDGKEFTKNTIKEKITLLDFWHTDCADCADMAAALKKVIKQFRGDTNIVFASISLDKDEEQWKAGIKQAKYTTGTAVNLFTAGKGSEHPMIKRYNIVRYPELLLIDAEGRILQHPVPDPRSEKGMAELLGLLKRESAAIRPRRQVIQHALANDGPYVLYEGEKAMAHTITNHVVKVEPLNLLNVQTDKPGTSFTVKLKPGLLPEATVYPQPAKLIALSDIEGNFDAFRKLLQANKIIDDRFNWIFGKGHLVLAGDMFDRGYQVTECLWLIYFLEEKAKAAGGYVHFILGNHEIMNLQGDHRYVQEKYINNAVRIGKPLTALYNDSSELGRWLRTKNIIEKIGNLLFVHAGISPRLAAMSLSPEQLNNLARPYYGGGIDSTNEQLVAVFNSSSSTGQTSPFWFRGYYEDLDRRTLIPTVKQVDSILKQFDVNHIVTGHTIVADTISLWYDNRIINTDTQHAKGISEALLVEDDHYYRVNTDGKRILLFVDDKKKAN